MKNGFVGNYVCPFAWVAAGVFRDCFRFTANPEVTAWVRESSVLPTIHEAIVGAISGFQATSLSPPMVRLGKWRRVSEKKKDADELAPLLFFVFCRSSATRYYKLPA
jgi:hypothetical protein